MIFKVSDTKVRLASLPIFTTLEYSEKANSFLDYRSGLMWFETCINLFLHEAASKTGAVNGRKIGFICGKELSLLFQKTKMLGSFNNDIDDPSIVGIYKGLKIWINREFPDNIGLVVFISDVTGKEDFAKFEIK